MLKASKSSKSIKKSTGRQCVSYSCPPEIFERISAVCDIQGCSKSWLISKAIENYLAELEEDIRDYQIAEKAWNEFLAGDQKTYTTDELRKEFGL